MRLDLELQLSQATCWNKQVKQLQIQIVPYRSQEWNKLERRTMKSTPIHLKACPASYKWNACSCCHSGKECSALLSFSRSNPWHIQTPFLGVAGAAVPSTAEKFPATLQQFLTRDDKRDNAPCLPKNLRSGKYQPKQLSIADLQDLAKIMLRCFQLWPHGMWPRFEWLML